MRRLLIALTLATLAGCARAPVPPLVAFVPPPPPAVVDPDTACQQSLSALHVAFAPVTPFGDPEEGCGIANPVNVSASTAAWNRPGVMTCSMAQTVARFDAEVIQPAAMTLFGQPVKKITHAGTYDCRYRRNGTTQVAAGATSHKGGRLSEHSKGRAIDVMGFELADGTTISVKRDWRGAGTKSKFLQQVARASCSSFNVVLTPNHDRLHQDHLHLDIGPHALCGY